jgi:nicotinamide-nucleotide adenylyltransferase
MSVLFIGRFQPFHLGHLSAVEYVSKVTDYIIIGVGSSQEKNTVENPFSYEERVEMINSSLSLDKSRYEIKPIPDFGNNEKWVKYIIENMPKFDVVYTNAPNEKKIFRNANIQVRNVPLFNRTVYNATSVRRAISSGKNWEELVPKGTASVIKKVNGVKRMTDLVLR